MFLSPPRAHPNYMIVEFKRSKKREKEKAELEKLRDLFIVTTRENCQLKREVRTLNILVGLEEEFFSEEKKKA